MGPGAVVRGLVGRLLPTLSNDDPDADKPVRLGRYREQYALSLIRKQHLLADEGTYFVANNAQTGIASVAAATFAATTPLIVIANSDAPGGKRVYLDYITLVTTAAGGWGSAGVNTQLAIYTDSTDRYTSGGTSITANIVSPNSDVATSASVAKVRFGNITAAAATGAVRAVCGLRILRPAVSATVADVVGETKQLNFGGVEAMIAGSITVANANQIPVPLPPIILGPGTCCLIYYMMNGTSPSAASFAPEFGWFER